MASEKYHIDFITFNIIKAMTFPEMCKWVETFYNAAYKDGNEAKDAATIDEAMEAIQKIDGIGPKRAEAIRKALDAL